ncbi:monofunctional biosynthetic peptidoglycan transglycosylase [Arachidicoccus terrestris]|uniref:monofunctional biosynthetic peptidoglycan transglycosylase n=1 Tax=Arachidicoccus terrestris TaxID=2875539 RepID=UPI001CC43986|nr:monofunctional biosynthetic peptidoglycan transglycosylase [Arachidicoccus terrestris]
MKKAVIWLLKTCLKLFALSIVYLVICKWVMPPVTLTQIGSLIGGNGLKRDYVSMEDISANVKLAAIAGEDQLFPTHGGFDWIALKESLSNEKGKRSRGSAASTISQQTAKNVFLWQGSGFTKYLRKGPEFVYTKLIEWIWGKKRILEVYLNVIEMGKGIYGIQAAAKNYYQKDAADLTRNEAASIIACLPNPKKFTVKPRSRYVNWKSAWILRQMHNIQGNPEIRPLVETK